MPQFKYVSYERLDGGEIVRILLNRPDSRNAQNRGLLIELDELLLQAEADDAVRVVILGGVGPIFSSGHDMGSKEARTELESGPSQHPTTTIKGGTRAGSERLPRCHGWRDLATGLSLDTAIIFLVRPTHVDVEGGPKWHLRSQWSKLRRILQCKFSGPSWSAECPLSLWPPRCSSLGAAEFARGSRHLLTPRSNLYYP